VSSKQVSRVVGFLSSVEEVGRSATWLLFPRIYSWFGDYKAS